MIEYQAPDLNLMSGVISVATATLACLIFIFTTTSKRFKTHFQNKFSPPTASIRKVLHQRMLGTILYGLIPAGIILFVFQRPMNQFGLATGNIMKSFLWWIPLACLVVLITYVGARNEYNLARYPQIRVNQWNRGLLWLSAMSWVIYLIGYEFLFRGFLLFSCLESFGYWSAIIINICLYSLFHIHKGFREAFGSLFFGFILCYLTLYLGSLWFAIGIHVTLALSNEWFSLGFQPDMKLVKNGGIK
ncbi:CPBP family intramembrane glutamic endopeptidase [Bacteroidota bacterium]